VTLQTYGAIVNQKARVKVFRLCRAYTQLFGNNFVASGVISRGPSQHLTWYVGCRVVQYYWLSLSAGHRLIIRVTICLENLEMSGILTAVGECQGLY